MWKGYIYIVIKISLTCFKYKKQRSLDMYTIICCINMNEYVYIYNLVYTDTPKKNCLEGITWTCYLGDFGLGDLECGEGHFASLFLFFYIIWIFQSWPCFH